MTLIDTHTHLYLADFENDIDAIIKRASAEGVTKFFLPAIDSSEFERLVKLERLFPGKCYAMIGLHPCSVKENFNDELTFVEEALLHRRFAAIGEIGLDLYWDISLIDQQYDSFHRQIELALTHKLPVVIHSRDALDETISVVAQYYKRGLCGIFHCFGGTIEQAIKIIETGFYLGIGGVVTYKNSGLDVVLKNIDLKHLVLETDAPYLTPVPFRGKRNESGYLKYIVAKIAAIKNVTVEEVAIVTTQNAGHVFSF